MKIIFKITMVDKDGTINSYKKNFKTYPEAEQYIKDNMPKGIYQIHKIFVIE